MSGNKNSGRKTWDKEIQSRKLWDLSIPVLKFALKTNKTTLDKKIEIALALVNKMIPTNLKGEGFENKTYNIFANLKEMVENASKISRDTNRIAERLPVSVEKQS